MANVAKIVSLIGKVARVERKPIPKKPGKDPELKKATSATEVIKKEKYLKETMARPVARNRNVPKPSTKSLTPNEKRYEALGKKAPVTVTKKRPMSPMEIKKARATARKEKFDKVLSPRPKPKSNRAPLKPIDNSRGSNRPVKPRLTDAQQILDDAANNPLNSMYGGKPKPSIAEGRGNIQQPPSVTTSRIRSTSRQLNRERRKAKQADKRDRLADIAGAKRVDYKKPRVIKYTTGPKSAKPGTTKRMKIGDQTVSRTNDPRNATSDAGNMRERLRAIDAKAAANRKRRATGKGGNKISPELKAKVYATLNSGKTARKSRELQNTFNKPKFSRNVTTGKLRATRPIKPVKK